MAVWDVCVYSMARTKTVQTLSWLRLTCRDGVCVYFVMYYSLFFKHRPGLFSSRLLSCKGKFVIFGDILSLEKGSNVYIHYILFSGLTMTWNFGVGTCPFFPVGSPFV